MHVPEKDGTTSAMTEPTTMPSPPLPPAEVPGGNPGNNKGLKRLLKALVILLVIVVVIFGVVYYFGQRTQPTPSIADQAITSSEQLVRDHPNDVGARLALAASYAQGGRTEESLGQYREILKFAKDHRVALMGAGRIMFEQGDFAGAKPMFDALIAKAGTGEFSSTDPQLEEAYYYNGASKLSLGDTSGGIKDLQAALAIDRSDADAWYRLGTALNKTSDFEGAVNALRLALSFVPTDWCEPLDGLSTAYQGLKRADGVAYATGMAEVCRGDYEAGAEKLKTVESGDFALSAALGLGIAAEKTGDVKQATVYYKKVLNNEPTNVAALSALARLGVAHGPTPTPSASKSGDSTP